MDYPKDFSGGELWKFLKEIWGYVVIFMGTGGGGGVLLNWWLKRKDRAKKIEHHRKRLEKAQDADNFIPFLSKELTKLHDELDQVKKEVKNLQKINLEKDRTIEKLQAELTDWKIKFTKLLGETKAFAMENATLIGQLSQMRGEN